MSRPCPGCGASDAGRFADKDSYQLVRCRRCATLYTAEAVENAYGDRYAEAAEPASFLAGRLDDIVAGFESLRCTGRLLDVGFGAGDLLLAARRAGWSVSGVEVARPAVERARQQGIEAFHGTLAEAGYEAGAFDVIVASELVEHIIEVGPLLATIHGLLRRGGLLWATTPHGRGLSARLLGPSWSVVNPPEHVQLFSIRGVRELFRRAGFASVSILAEGTNPQEIWQHWRGREVSSARRIDSAYALNAFLEQHRGRRAVKRAANRVLSMLRLGDSLKIAALKHAP